MSSHSYNQDSPYNRERKDACGNVFIGALIILFFIGLLGLLSAAFSSCQVTRNCSNLRDFTRFSQYQDRDTNDYEQQPEVKWQ